VKPEISLSLITSALADFLAYYFPGVPVYNNPNQQSTELPAWFINFMPGSEIKKQIGNRYLRSLRVDLVYLDEYNLPDLYDRYLSVAETLDEKLELFAYDFEGKKYVMRTQDRNWRVSLADLHYEFNLNIRTSLSNPPNPFMQTIDSLNQKIKIIIDKGGASWTNK